MEDITESVAAFREAARHLWNSVFLPDADWDTRDRFSEVCVELFEALVVGPLEIESAQLPQMWEPALAAIPCLRVVPRSMPAFRS